MDFTSIKLCVLELLDHLNDNPDDDQVMELVVKLNYLTFNVNDYVGHLFDLTFNNTAISDSVKAWFLKHIKDDKDGYKNLRFQKAEEKLVFIKSSIKYNNSYLSDIPQHIWEDSEYNWDWYNSIIGYIRKNCDLRRLDIKWHGPPFQI